MMVVSKQITLKQGIIMTGTTAKAHLFELLIEPLKSYESLSIYRTDLMRRVMSMSDLEVRERLLHMQQLVA